MSIANACPSLAQPALARAVKLLRESREPQLYQNAVAMHNNLPGLAAADQIEPDKKWLDDVQSLNASERNKLEVELKAYTSNMIKESIRVCSINSVDLFTSHADCSHHRWHTATLAITTDLQQTMPTLLSTTPSRASFAQPRSMSLR